MVEFSRTGIRYYTIFTIFRYSSFKKCVNIYIYIQVYLNCIHIFKFHDVTYLYPWH